MPTDTATLRFTTVINAAKKIIAARQEWNQQDGPNIHWNGAITKQISQKLDETIRRCCDATADFGKEVEEKARALMLCLDDVAISHQRWLQDASMGLPTAPPRGSDQLHRVLDQLEQQLQTVSLPAPPPMAQLKEQGVSPNQIAIIYGWKNKDGDPDTEMVFEELQEPGKHYKKAKWVHPAEKSIREEVNRRWKMRQERQALFLRDSNGSELQSDDNDAEPMIPTIDELLAAKAPVAQIMRLHDMTEEEVLELAQAAGVDLTEREIVPANASVAQQERMAKESTATATA